MPERDDNKFLIKATEQHFELKGGQMEKNGKGGAAYDGRQVEGYLWLHTIQNTATVIGMDNYSQSIGHLKNCSQVRRDLRINATVSFSSVLPLFVDEEEEYGKYWFQQRQLDLTVSKFLNQNNSFKLHWKYSQIIGAIRRFGHKTNIFEIIEDNSNFHGEILIPDSEFEYIRSKVPDKDPKYAETNYSISAITYKFQGYTFYNMPYPSYSPEYKENGIAIQSLSIFSER